MKKLIKLRNLLLNKNKIDIINKINFFYNNKNF